MAYEPTNWKSGDVVTSAKLNKMEQGIASGVVVFHGQTSQHGTEPYVLTVEEEASEIFEAIENGSFVTLEINSEVFPNDYTVAYLKDYTMPHDDYTGFLRFITPAEFHSPAGTQVNMRQATIYWDDGWVYEYWNVTVVPNE